MHPAFPLLLAALLAAAGSPLRAGAPGASPPNVVMILADDLGYGNVGCFYQNDRPAGLPRHHTPRLDAMAQAGARLTHHYAGAPVCVSSRVSLLTGRSPGHSPVRDARFDAPIPSDHLTLAGLLRTAGYHTAIVGKWGLAGPAPALPGHPLLRGFDSFYGTLSHGDNATYYPGDSGRIVADFTPVTNGLEHAYTTDLFTARAKHEIITRATQSPGQPFFLLLSYTAPHYYTDIPTQAYPAGSGLSGGLTWPLNTASGADDSWLHPDYAAATHDHDGNPATAPVPWPEASRRFATQVRRMDDGVGDLLQTLVDLGIHTNTVVVFSSDNGPDDSPSLNGLWHGPDFFRSNGPLDGYKNDVWEGGIRMPCIVWAPGRFPGGATVTTPSAFWDWMPTLAELAGLPPPAVSQGRSLLPALAGTGAPRPHPALVWEYFAGGASPASLRTAARKPSGTPYGHMQAIRIGDHTGVRYHIADASDPVSLYDVVLDPFQSTPLEADPAHRARLTEMQRLLLGARMPHPLAPRPFDNAPVPAVGQGGDPGLDVRMFEGSWPWIPDFGALSPAATNTTAALDPALGAPGDHTGLEFTGFLRVEQSGRHEFHLTSDAGAALWLHEANVIPDARPGGGGTASGSIVLAAGLHPFRLAYVHGTGPRQLLLEWSSPAFTRRPVPASAYARTSCAPDRLAAADDSAQTRRGQPVDVDVTANDPACAGFPLLLSVSAPLAGGAGITNNTVRYQPAADFLGVDTFSYVTAANGLFATGRVDVAVCFAAPDLWLPLNEGRGLVVHEAGGLPAAPLSLFAPDAWQPGRHGGALAFDGLDDHLAVSGHAPPSGPAPRTVSAWIRTTGAGAVCGWGALSPSAKWVFRVQADAGHPRPGSLRVEVEGGHVAGWTDLRDGEWHHVACVLPDLPAPNVTNVVLYVDGRREPVSTLIAAEVNTAPTPLTVGTDLHGRFLGGRIDEFRLFPSALDDAGVAALHAATGQPAAAWARRHLGTESPDWGADPESDGRGQFAEYAFGGQPWLPDAAAGRLLPGPGAFEVRLRRRAGLAVSAEISPDLVVWDPLPGLLPPPTADAQDPDFEWIVIPVPTAPGRAAVRARLTAP